MHDQTRVKQSESDHHDRLARISLILHENHRNPRFPPDSGFRRNPRESRESEGMVLETDLENLQNLMEKFSEIIENR